MKKESITDFRYNAVYYVDVANSRVSFNPIAIRPYLQAGYVGWEDTVKSRLFKVVQENSSYTNPSHTLFPEKISLKLDGNVNVNLIFLSVDLYNKKVKNSVIGCLEFDSDDALQQYYLSTNFYLQ